LDVQQGEEPILAYLRPERGASDSRQAARIGKESEVLSNEKNNQNQQTQNPRFSSKT
jgi:hypothetical protein